MYMHKERERSDSVVECLNQDPGVGGSSLTGVTAICPWARQINPSLVLVQPRKARLGNTEKIVDWDVKNQIKQTHMHKDTL